jgi:hypothetical protein
MSLSPAPRVGLAFQRFGEVLPIRTISQQHWPQQRQIEPTAAKVSAMEASPKLPNATDVSSEQKYTQKCCHICFLNRLLISSQIGLYR